MKLAVTLLAALLVATGARAADPVYLDQLIETPVATLEAQFGQMKREGCFQTGPNQFLLMTIDKKDRKPWRVVISSIEPCKKPLPGPQIEIGHRSGIHLGDKTMAVVERLGRPDAAAAPDVALKKLGETEYFYICRVEAGCARHTSVLMREGVVTAIAEWYSE
ncbi:MAG TPA: hypothetical protein VF787_11195 [Thermoanaerobaculia bacterium]